MLSTRVKICGLTNAEDVLAACAAGADALGFVFYKPSKRYVRTNIAKQLSDLVPPLVQRVGLFVDASADEVQQVLNEVELDLLQFHGNETADFCEQFSTPYIKALAVKPDEDLAAVMLQYENARGFLLDTYKAGVPGGTGESFDWNLFPSSAQVTKPLILAGGLTPDNIASAIAQTNTYAVDVSGGVELAPGKKSAAKMQAFVQAAKLYER